MSNLNEDITAQGWLTQAFGVLTMDDLWTRQLNVVHMTPEEMHDTAELGEALLASWQRLTGKGALKELGNYLQHNAARAAEAAQANDGSVIPADDMDAHAWGVGILVELERASAHESAVLMRKIGSLRVSTWTSGDLSPHARCLLLGACTMIAYALGHTDFADFLGGSFVGAGCPTMVIGTPQGGG